MTGRPTAGPVGDVVAVLGAFLAAGLAGGVLWWLLADPPRYTVTRGGPRMGEVQLAGQFALDGWYAVLGIVLGSLTGIVLTWRRSRDPLATTLLIVPGALLAAVVARWTGGVLGPDGLRAALDRAPAGSQVPVPLEVSDGVFLLVWPIAALAGAVMLLWSSSGPSRPADRHPADRHPADRQPADAQQPEEGRATDIADPHHGRSPKP